STGRRSAIASASSAETAVSASQPMASSSIRSSEQLSLLSSTRSTQRAVFGGEPPDGSPRDGSAPDPEASPPALPLSPSPDACADAPPVDALKPYASRRAASSSRETSVV